MKKVVKEGTSMIIQDPATFWIDFLYCCVVVFYKVESFVLVFISCKDLSLTIYYLLDYSS